MKKSMIFVFSMILLLSLSLTACNLGDLTGGNANTAEGDVVQTMVALAFTQTAIAESAPSDKPALEETEAPPADAAVEAASEETEAPIEITHTLTPGEPGWVNKWFYDTDASKTAGSGYVTGGDDFVANLFERPFTESEMVYRPDVDINKTEMSEDSTFYYVTLYLNGEHPDGGLQAMYGIEIDTDRDGRGDLLVIADRPASTDWDIAGVSAHTDPNHNVGGTSIMRPDAGYSGDGYEEVVFSMDVLDDPDAAWARVNLGASPSVTIAFKKSLIAGYGTFVWGVWAADSLLDPALIDLHDNFTQAEAGSPYQSHSTYPLAAVNLVDNTCRETYGFEAESPIPGLCYIPEIPTPTPTVTPTQPPAPGSITGSVFYDNNGNGTWDSGESAFTYGVTITLHANSCSSPAISSTSSNSFSFSNLAAGSYCIKATASSGFIPTTPTQFNVTVTPGGAIYVEFGFFVFG